VAAGVVAQTWRTSESFRELESILVGRSPDITDVTTAFGIHDVVNGTRILNSELVRQGEKPHGRGRK
jgi:hypothetical protein